ncbi:MAG TPA: ASCH domain-containing protein [Sedimentisphaerales bacterium]|nr:ASCH domain-containing protein [Sedimentisphaerales bacterium]
MKAISVHQPFASLIASGEKTIETRKWRTSYLGELLIVSTQRKCELYPDLPVGTALCIVDLIGCRKMEKQDEEWACCQYYKGAYAWILTDVRRVAPFPVRGKQGFYEVELPNFL